MMRAPLTLAFATALAACANSPRDAAPTSRPVLTAPLPVETARLYEIGDVKLYTVMRGHGPPILFLHGGLRYFDNSFSQQAAYFAAFRTVVGVDQRGHGHSPDNARPFSYRDMADNTAALIRKLDVGPVDIVGWSDGGNVGLLIARFHPELVRRLVVSGANIRGDYDGAEAYEEFRRTSVEAFAANLPPSLREDYSRVSPDGENHWFVFVGKTKELWMTRVVLEPADLAAIQVPVLVMAGDHDAISLEQTLAIFRGLPKGQLCIFPATGHATMSERPEDFNRLT